nr:cryptochrome/photolyase family protein [Rhabdothermincola salaria]
MGDQLSRQGGALAGRRPGEVRVLLVESRGKWASRRWHRQRLHLVVASMRRLARELTEEGFEVDLRTADSLADGLAAHRRRYRPERVVAMSPMSWDGAELLARCDVATVANDQFLCSAEQFAEWAGDRSRLRMEDFYRWQRTRLGYLMDGDEPTGGRWNHDAANREPPPTDGRPWPAPLVDDLDELDDEVLADIERAVPELWGGPPDGTWATSRSGALARLDHFVDEVLPLFGPHEDAMLRDEWKLAHSTLSPYLNLGLLHPGEVADAAAEAHRRGSVPIASAEGFVRQVIGWREYVWGVYWLWMPGYRSLNALDARRPLPPVLRGGPTDMACVGRTLAALDRHGWLHHIERLMVLGNLGLLAGVAPDEMVEWMWSSFVDGAEWVMLPNVVGMALHADGGRMATKPYAAGGAYLNRMSDHCGTCRYDPRRRVGADACPFTTLYWDFLARHEDGLRGNHRMGNPLGSMRRLRDLPAVRERATEVLAMLDDGTL